MNDNPSKSSSTFELFLVVGMGLIFVSTSITSLYPVIKSGSLDSLYFIGRHRGFIVYGYEALFLHVSFLIFGLMTLFMSLGQFKATAEKEFSHITLVTKLYRKNAFLISGTALLSNAAVNTFFLSISGKLELTGIIFTSLDFVLAILLFYEFRGVRKLVLIRAIFGLVLFSFLQSAGEPFTSLWFETISVQLCLLGSLIFLLAWQKSLWNFIFGGMLAIFYIAYQALMVFSILNT